MNDGFLRRTVLIGFWPLADFIVTIFANVLLVNTGVIRSVIATSIFASALNVLFLYLLNYEKGLYDIVVKTSKKVGFLKLQKLSAKIGKTLAILLVYLVSGPAMVGAPLIWLLGIRGRKAYMLAILGVTLNSIIWVGGFYHLFWTLVRTVAPQFIPLL